MALGAPLLATCYLLLTTYEPITLVCPNLTLYGYILLFENYYSTKKPVSYLIKRAKFIEVRDYTNYFLTTKLKLAF